MVPQGAYEDRAGRIRPPRAAKPSAAQRAWLRRGLREPGGKLPLFDAAGQLIRERTIRCCLENGWVEPWFDNPLKPGWHVCKLTPTGRARALEREGE